MESSERGHGPQRPAVPQRAEASPSSEAPPWLQVLARVFTFYSGS